MSFPYSPASPSDNMSFREGQQLPSLSQQFPEVIVPKPQSPPKTPRSASSPPTRTSPPKRRWSERSESEDIARERKRPALQPLSGTAPASSHTRAAMQPSSDVPRTSLPSHRSQIQLPPLQTFLDQSDDGQRAGARPRAPDRTRLESFAFSHQPSRDQFPTRRPPPLLDQPSHQGAQMPDRRHRWEEPHREHFSPHTRHSHTSLVTTPTTTEWRPSPPHAIELLPRSAPSTYPLPAPPRRDELGRSYSATSPTQAYHYPSMAYPPESRRYSAEHVHTSSHAPSSEPRSRYVWELPPASVASSSSAIPGLANPNGRKRRGNLPKESTQVLNEWFVNHASFPYPKETEKQHLQAATGLSLSQISNWFINARRRRRPETTGTLQPAPPQESREMSPVRGGAGPPPPHMGQSPYPPQRNPWDRTQ